LRLLDKAVDIIIGEAGRVGVLEMRTGRGSARQARL
jgi:hypothetical protein